MARSFIPARSAGFLDAELHLLWASLLILAAFHRRRVVVLYFPVRRVWRSSLAATSRASSASSRYSRTTLKLVRLRARTPERGDEQRASARCPARPWRNVRADIAWLSPCTGGDEALHAAWVWRRSFGQSRPARGKTVQGAYFSSLARHFLTGLGLLMTFVAYPRRPVARFGGGQYGRQRHRRIDQRPLRQIRFFGHGSHLRGSLCFRRADRLLQAAPTAPISALVGSRLNSPRFRRKSTEAPAIYLIQSQLAAQAAGHADEPGPAPSRSSERGREREGQERWPESEPRAVLRPSRAR